MRRIFFHSVDLNIKKNKVFVGLTSNQSGILIRVNLPPFERRLKGPNFFSADEGNE